MKRLLALLGCLVMASCGGGSDTVSTSLESAKVEQKSPGDKVETSAASGNLTARATAVGLIQPMSALQVDTTVVNGNFESGSTGWSQTSTGGYNIISNFSQYPAYAGSWYSWLGGYSNGTDVLQQDVTIPSLAKLQFRYHITTQETSTSTAYDTLKIELTDTTGTSIATLANFNNLTTTTGWTLSPEYDLSAYAGRTLRLRFTAKLDISNSTSFRLDDILVYPSSSTGGTPVVSTNCSNLDWVSGWWWNPTESGRGFAVERQGNKLFTAAFLYEDSGSAAWYISEMTQVGNSNAFTGNVMRYSGGQSLLGTYKAPTGSLKIGVATITFSSTSSAALSVQASDGSLPINIALQRFPISNPVFSNSQVGFQSGWWWNENEGGRGYFIEVQGTSSFLGGFMYDDVGQPTWYVSTTDALNASASGKLLRYTGGQTLAGSYRPASANGTAGQLSFEFTSTKTGVMILPNGNRIALKRFEFNPSSPVSTDCTPASVSWGNSGGTGTATGISAFAGTYTVSGAGSTGTFNVNSSGSVTSCTVGRIVRCTGQLDLNSNGGANFNISGNDGGAPVDTQANMSGTISSSGIVSGSISGSSVSEGGFTGSVSGSRTSSGNASGGGTNTGSNSFVPNGIYRVPLSSTLHELWDFSGSLSDFQIIVTAIDPQHGDLPVMQTVKKGRIDSINSYSDQRYVDFTIQSFKIVECYVYTSYATQASIKSGKWIDKVGSSSGGQYIFSLDGSVMMVGRPKISSGGQSPIYSAEQSCSRWWN